MTSNKSAASFASPARTAFSCAALERCIATLVSCALGVALFLSGTVTAQAAIVEQAPVIDGFFNNNPTIGRGAIIPLAHFRRNGRWERFSLKPQGFPQSERDAQNKRSKGWPGIQRGR